MLLSKSFVYTLLLFLPIQSTLLSGDLEVKRALSNSYSDLMLNPTPKHELGSIPLNSFIRSLTQTHISRSEENSKFLEQQLVKYLNLFNKHIDQAKEEVNNNDNSFIGVVFKKLSNKIKISFKDILATEKDPLTHLSQILTTLSDYPEAAHYYNKKEESLDSSFKKRDDYLADKYLGVIIGSERENNLIVDETKDLEKILKLINKKFKGDLTDDELDELSAEYVDDVKKAIREFKERIKDKGEDLLDNYATTAKTYIDKGKEITPAGVREELNNTKEELKQILEYLKSPEKAKQFKEELRALDDQLYSVYYKLDQLFWKKTPIRQTIANLRMVISDKIFDTDQITQLTQEKLKQLYKELESHFDTGFNSIDESKLTEKINQVSSKVADLLQRDFSENLTAIKLNEVLDKLAKSATDDLDGLKDSSNESNFVMTAEEWNSFIKEIQTTLKSIRDQEETSRFTVNLEPLDNELKDLTDFIRHNYKPESLHRTRDINKIMEGIFKAENLISPIEDKIIHELKQKNYINDIKLFIKKNFLTNKYIKESVDYLDKNSSFFNILSEYLSKQKGSSGRLLVALHNDTLNNKRQLTQADIESVKLVRNLLMRMMFNYENKVNYGKVLKETNTRLLEIIYNKGLDIGSSVTHFKRIHYMDNGNGMDKKYHEALNNQLKHNLKGMEDVVTDLNRLLWIDEQGQYKEKIRNLLEKVRGLNNRID